MADAYLANVKFLVVEDNKFMATVVRRVLNSLGTKEVRECADGADALKVLKTFPADIVITDWAMEPLDGIELTRMIRTASDSHNPYVPIIMLTAYSEMIRIVEARDAGVNEFVVKPISVNTLFSRIQAVIEKPRPYIRINNFFGPDRRRRRKDVEESEERRGVPKVAVPASEAKTDLNPESLKQDEVDGILGTSHEN